MDSGLRQRNLVTTGTQVDDLVKNKFCLLYPESLIKNRAEKGASQGFTYSQDAFIAGTRDETPLFIGVNNHNDKRLFTSNVGMIYGVPNNSFELIPKNFCLHILW